MESPICCLASCSADLLQRLYKHDKPFRVRTAHVASVLSNFSAFGVVRCLDADRGGSRLSAKTGSKFPNPMALSTFVFEAKFPCALQR